MGRQSEGCRIYWRSGWAWVRFTHQGQDYRLPLGTKEPPEAEKRAAFEYAATLSGRRAQVERAGRVERPDLERAIAQWAASYEGVLADDTLGTIYTYGRHFMAFFAGRWEGITALSCKDYGRARLRSALRTTVLRELSYLRAFLGWSEERHYVLEAPDVAQLPKKAAGRRTGRQRAKPVDVTPEEAHAIVERLPVASKRIDGRKWPVRARFHFARETALRPASVSKLSCPENWRPGAATLTLFDAQDKARFGRELDLSEGALQALSEAAALLEDGKGLLFGKHRFTKRIKPAAKQVLGDERGKHFAPYDFRHGLLTAMADAGASLTGIAYVGGHRKLSTTAIYTRPNRKAGQEALRAMAARQSRTIAAHEGPGVAKVAPEVAEKAGWPSGFEPPTPGATTQHASQKQREKAGVGRSGEPPKSPVAPGFPHNVQESGNERPVDRDPVVLRWAMMALDSRRGARVA